MRIILLATLAVLATAQIAQNSTGFICNCPGKEGRDPVCGVDSQVSLHHIQIKLTSLKGVQLFWVRQHHALPFSLRDYGRTLYYLLWGFRNHAFDS